ncbi:MAG: 30S ribosomal protein S17 [Candidatus Micrarchaeia archaeon]
MECDDKHCFVHGNLSIRGQILVGTVVSAKAKRTAIVERPTVKYITKYRRYARTSSKIPAHNPPCMNAKEGDIVKIGECRKISRTKAWSIIEIIKRAEKK